jgi:hypothetical protein
MYVSTALARNCSRHRFFGTSLFLSIVTNFTIIIIFTNML